jgi:hypothetical protein
VSTSFGETCNYMRVAFQFLVWIELRVDHWVVNCIEEEGWRLDLMQAVN